jgi:beta-galactosidase
VIANKCDAVELSVNGQSIGEINIPTEDGYVYAFPEVVWTPGTIKAVGYMNNKEVCSDSHTTVGPATAIRLTPIVGPEGLFADGEDVALFDVEVIDAQGRRCPTDEDRIDFSVSGPGTWRGGYNSGRLNSTNNLYLYTECGINRVAIRATREPGVIMLTASRPGLNSAVASVRSHEFAVVDGLATADRPR